MLLILAILIIPFQSSYGEVVISSNSSLIRVSRQVDPHDPSHWRDIEGLPISEEAVNAGGYSTPQCEPITVPICQGAFYEYTRMPNILNHETQEEAALEVS
nr:hypothetical transcript [Hymenolepis microstoma]